MARARSSAMVTQKKLLQVEGLDEIIARIETMMSFTTARWLKELYVEASKPLWSRAKDNIKGLPVSAQAKEVLDAMMMINQGEPQKQHVLSGMSQAAGVKKLGRHFEEGKKRHEMKKRFIPNPYWFEFGTKGGMRPTPFFRPAVSSMKPIVAARLEEGFKQIVQTVEEMAAKGVTSASKIRFKFYH